MQPACSGTGVPLELPLAQGQQQQWAGEGGMGGDMQLSMEREGGKLLPMAR